MQHLLFSGVARICDRVLLRPIRCPRGGGIWRIPSPVN